jgi:hypothetical protein
MTNDLLTEFRSAVSLPDEATARRIYACATSAPRRMPRRRLAVAIAVSLVVAAIALAFSGLFGSPKQSQSPRVPPAYEPLQLTFTRSGQTITAIAVTANDPTPDAVLQLQVRHSDASVLEAMNGNSDVVFQEQVPMSDIASPASGPSGTVALSTWSGTLSPSDWDGGCQGANAIYSVRAVIVPAGDSFGGQVDGRRDETDSRWFSCSSS